MRAAAGTRAWLFWAASAVGAGALAFGAGASGLLGNPERAEDFPAAVVAPVEETALLDCPGGRPVAVAANVRLFVVGRTADEAWLAVRSPQLGYRTVWLRALPVSAESDSEVTIADLPVRECVTPEVRR